MKIKLFLLIAIATGLAVNEVNAQTDTIPKRDTSRSPRDTAARRDTLQLQNLDIREAKIVKKTDELTAGWPEVSRKAALEMEAKYGAPDDTNAEYLVWKDKGNWQMIIVSRDIKKPGLPIDKDDYNVSNSKSAPTKG